MTEWIGWVAAGQLIVVTGIVSFLVGFAVAGCDHLFGKYHGKGCECERCDPYDY